MIEPEDAVPLDYENWSPVDLIELKSILDVTDRPWWVAGGTAVDLFLGKRSRDHHDIDVAVLRSDQLFFQTALSGWDLQVPTGEWDGEPYESMALFRRWEKGMFLTRTVSQAWCRRSVSDPWSFELLFAEGNSKLWRFKRDPDVKRPLEEIGLTDDRGTPYLAPEIVLLHKATSSFPGNEVGSNQKEILERELARRNAQQDFDLLLEAMDESRRAWLRDALRRVKPGHRWLDRL